MKFELFKSENSDFVIEQLNKFAKRSNIFIKDFKFNTIVSKSGSIVYCILVMYTDDNY